MIWGYHYFRKHPYILQPYKSICIPSIPIPSISIFDPWKVGAAGGHRWCGIGIDAFFRSRVANGTAAWLSGRLTKNPDPTNPVLGFPTTFTLPIANIAPENGWLKCYFPFGMAYFQGILYVCFREGTHHVLLQLRWWFRSGKIWILLSKRVSKLMFLYGKVVYTWIQNLPFYSTFCWWHVISLQLNQSQRAFPSRSFLCLNMQWWRHCHKILLPDIHVQFGFWFSQYRVYHIADIV